MLLINRLKLKSIKDEQKSICEGGDESFNRALDEEKVSAALILNSNDLLKGKKMNSGEEKRILWTFSVCQDHKNPSCNNYPLYKVIKRLLLITQFWLM